MLAGAGHTTDGDLKAKRLGHGTRKHLFARALSEAATDAHGRLTGSQPLRVFCAVLGLLRRLPLPLLLLLLLPLLHCKRCFPYDYDFRTTILLGYLPAYLHCHFYLLRGLCYCHCPSSP